MGTATDTIVCPGCGERRIVTDRQARRHHATPNGIHCSRCRGRSAYAHRPSEQHLNWWLKQFGTPAPKGTSAADFIVAGGANPDLVRLAKTVYPPTTRTSRQAL